MPTTVNDILDQTLPPELQRVVRTLASDGSATGQQQAQQAPREETPMPDLTKTDVETIALAAATKAAQDLLKQKDAEQAVANKIAGLEQERDAANAEASNAKAEASKAQHDLAAANKNVEKLSADLAAANDKATKAEAGAADLTRKLDDANKSVADLKVQVTKLNTEKAVTGRVQKLTEAGLASQPRIERFTATKEDGTFKVGDEDFDAAVADLKSAFDAGKGSTSQTTQQQATTTAGAADKGEANKGDDKGGQQQTQTQATASTTTPAAPDLSNVEQYTQATASLLAGGSPKPTDSGRSAYASAFGGLE